MYVFYEERTKGKEREREIERKDKWERKRMRNK
jgi:hypothetical protein